MKYNMLFGIVAFGFLWFLSRNISEKGVNSLNEEEKSKLVGVLAKFRIFNMIIPLIILFLFFGIIVFYSQLNKLLLLSVIFTAFLIYMIVTNFLSYLSLKKASIPGIYLKYFIISRLLGMFSIALVAVSMVLPF